MIASDDPIKKYEPLWGNWQVVDLLGEGSYGRVYRVARRDGGMYESAVKLISIPKSEAEIQEARRMGMDQRSVYAYFENTVQRISKEISIMHSLKGEPHVVAYEDHQIIHEEGSLQWDILIRMELLIPLDAYAANMVVSPDETRRLGIEICSALEVCAARGIIHRDIKEGNIFLNSRGIFKLGDFGIAREMSGTGSMSMSMRGTPAYIAPEVYNGLRYDARADIYSLGVLLYKLLNGGRYPFLPPAPMPISLDDTEQAFSKRIKGEIPPMPANGGPMLGAAVMCAISYDPQARFNNATAFKMALLNTSSAEPPCGQQRPEAAPQPTTPQAAPKRTRRYHTYQTPSYAAPQPSAVPYAAAIPKTKNSKTALYIAAVVLVVAAVVLAVVLAGLPALQSDGAATLNNVDLRAQVDWNDPAMGILLGDALDKAPEQITNGDLAAIKELYINGEAATLSGEEFGSWDRAYEDGAVQSFEDLRYCTGLTTLCINDQRYDSLEPIGSLRQLNILEIKGLTQSDALPVDIEPLQSLTNMKRLILLSCDVRDISALAQLSTLEFLFISKAPELTDISAVSEMKGLHDLRIVKTKVSAVPDVSGLSKLSSLWLYDCEVIDTSGLNGNTSISYLQLDGNSITALTDIITLSNLKTLWLGENAITDLQGIGSLSQLETLALDSNQIVSIESLATLDAVKYVAIFSNPVTDITPLLEMDALEEVLVTEDKSMDETVAALKAKNVKVS